MIYGSVCSGIEAATVAWHGLGWRPAFFSEIEAFPCAVLKHYHPDVPNLGDMNKFKEWPDAALDVLVGGTPCQSFSVAGLRKGLDDPRGNLTLVYLAIAARYRPEWVVWENVPGVLSDATGAFGAFLGGLGQLGYWFAYRVLDAQYFGVPQRRRRVFVVGCLGGWQRAAAVLFERASLSGNPAPSREARERVAGSLAARTRGGGGLGTDFDLDGGLGSRCLNAGGMGRQDFETETLIAHSLRADGFDAREDGTGRGTPLVPVAFDERNITSVTNRSNPQPGDPCHTLHEGAGSTILTLAIRGRGDSHDLEYRDDGVANAILTPNGGRAGIGVGAIAFSSKDHGADAGETAPTLRSMGHDGSHANGGGQVAVAFESRFARNGRGAPSDVVPPLKAQSGETGKGDAAPLLQHGMQVRRLTPRECERLQGFPDDYTLVEVRGKPAADGPRYKALGNSMAVPVMRWIGERIQAVSEFK